MDIRRRTQPAIRIDRSCFFGKRESLRAEFSQERNMIMKTKEFIKIIATALIAVSFVVVTAACDKKESNTKETKRKERNDTTTDAIDEEEEKESPTDNDDPMAKVELPLDSMSDQEIFEFCRRNLTLELIDGESSEELEERLPAQVEMDRHPYSVSMDAGLVFDYGYPLDSEICITEVAFCCNWDYENDIVTNLLPEDTGGYMDRQATVTMRITNDHGEELYEYFKEQYSAMYPGTEIYYMKDEYDDWFDFRLVTEDGLLAHARIVHYRAGYDELFVEEAHLIID